MPFYYSVISLPLIFSFFFFNDTATTEIYTLSLHDALPISLRESVRFRSQDPETIAASQQPGGKLGTGRERSEEHTSELQSPDHLVCRLLLEKKKKKKDEVDGLIAEQPKTRDEQVVCEIIVP